MGGKPENCVTFLSPKGVKRTISSQDLLQIFEFCKMFWIANNACDIVNRKNYLCLSVVESVQYFEPPTESP